jgi:hypothetical protein
MTLVRDEHETLGALDQRQWGSPAFESEASRRELVRRIVNSPTFARSERLGTLLTYVCDMALKGREAEINELKIGQEVFGRSQNYDSAVDGIVRSQASRLRQRLEMYFEQEGANEPVRIVIPRGGYVPVFQKQSALLPAVTVADPIQPAPPLPPSPNEHLSRLHPTDSSPRRWPQWGLILVLALLLVALWVYDRRYQAPNAAAPPIHPFWSHLFTKGQTTMVVAPDSGLVLFRTMSGQDIDLKEYLGAGYRTELNEPAHTGPTATSKNQILDLANARYTSMADVEAILSLKDRARALGSEVSLRFARDLRPNDIKSGTVILLGASSADPWVELFEHNMNFLLRDDYTKFYGVMNRTPQNGEPARWESKKDDPQHRVFAVIAYQPDLAGNGNALIIEGTTVAGTEAAIDFVNDDAQLLPFLNQIRRSDGSLPHFELVLEAHNMSASAVQSQILAWRARN